MALENVRIYSIATGDNTYPHSGNFTIIESGTVTIDDSNGSGDALFGDFTHTGGGDVPDQNVTASTASGINVGDTIDVRYQYTVTGSDGSSGNVHFIATNSAANYGPNMVADFPMVPGVTYTFGTFNTDGAVDYDDLVPCFTPGTLILTTKGQVPIETLTEGDMIFTRDNGFQPLRWIGQRRVPAQGAFAPIRIAKGTFGSDRPLLISPNHRVLIHGAMAQLLFAETEVLVAAKHLTNSDGVSRMTGGLVTYIHILFDQHEIVVSNSAFSESFFPGPSVMNSMETGSRNEVLHLFPELADRDHSGFGSTARTCLTRHEAQLLQQYSL